jgi:histidine triad (HIT) family protein
MENCIFCKIIDGQIPSSPVLDNEWVYAFNDINPEAPHHILIVPKKHIKSLADISLDDIQLLAEVQLAAREIAVSLGVKEEGFRLVTNAGPKGGQTVDHLHYHFLAGRQMKWPPG